jgi:DNA-binding GntR family transcriptional regulator
MHHISAQHQGSGLSRSVDTTLAGFPTLAQVDLTARVHDILRQKILSLELVPGQRLSVRDLASAMGVSSTPVKAALDRLSAEGIVRMEPRRGTFVSPVSTEDVEDFFGVRLALETFAAETGCVKATGEDIENLRQAMLTCKSLIEQKPPADGPIAEFYLANARADSEFHLQIVRICGNRQLLSLYEALNLRVMLLRRSFVLWTPDQVDRTTEDHMMIFDAYVRRDIPALRLAISHHLESALSDTKRALQRIQEEKESGGEPSKDVPPGDLGEPGAGGR